MKNQNTFRLSIGMRLQDKNSAFTLIELLTVMAIIVALAGLVIGSASIIQNKAGRSRAQSEIAALNAAITSYQTDNGGVPRGSETDSLDPRTSFDPGKTTFDPAGVAGYQKASLLLYKLLCGSYYISTSNGGVTRWTSGSSDHPDRPKVYYEFKSNQVQLKDSRANVINGKFDPDNAVYAIDPFGLSYGYGTAYMADVDAGKNPPAKGFNPTYDLWSTAGYGAGKTYPSNVADSAKPNLWVTNWNGNTQ